MQEVLNSTDFGSKVLESEGRVLVEFFATWCPHCQRMQPILDDVTAKVAGQCAVYQVDVDHTVESRISKAMKFIQKSLIDYQELIIIITLCFNFF